MRGLQTDLLSSDSRRVGKWLLLTAVRRLGATLLYGSLCLQISAATAHADILEVLAPEARQREIIELGPNEVGELEIHLKSLGDMVGGYRLVALDDLDRQVGKNISDIHGLVRFTGMPAGRFRVLVEKRRNDRGGISTVQVGQILLTKRLKSAVEATSGEKSGQPVEEKKPVEKKPEEEKTPAKKSEEK